MAFCYPWSDVAGDITWHCPSNPEGFKSGELSSLGAILHSLVPYIFAIAGLILLFMIVSSGYSLLTSAGNPEAIAKGKSRLTAALVGFLIVFCAYWILQLIEVFLGIQGTQWGFT